MSLKTYVLKDANSQITIKHIIRLLTIKLKIKD